jgi:hypothetical protein
MSVFPTTQFQGPIEPKKDDRSAPLAGQDPVIWLVMSDKIGDNAQLQVVADALPWPYQVKRVTVREPYVMGKPRVAASLHHLDPARSDPLEPPWPDLVVTIGRRMSMVALWIQERSRGKTKIVLIGPPKRLLRRFDLAVASVQYRLPQRPNLLRINFPLQRVDEAAIAAEAGSWRSEFDRLSRPLTAVMIGGRTKAVRFDAAVAARLAGDLAALADREGGSLVVTTSRRTPAEVVAALEKQLPPGAVLHRWMPDGGRNPYRALLGLADRFVVTGDSISMLMEIARLGRPLAIYPLPLSSWPGSGRFARAVQLLLPARLSRRLRHAVGEIESRLGAIGHDRDLTAIHRLMIKEGHAVWFGDPFPIQGRRLPDELPEVIARIRSLLG